MIYSEIEINFKGSILRKKKAVLENYISVILFTRWSQKWNKWRRRDQRLQVGLQRGSDQHTGVLGRWTGFLSSVKWYLYNRHVWEFKELFTKKSSSYAPIFRIQILKKYKVSCVSKFYKKEEIEEYSKHGRIIGKHSNDSHKLTKCFWSLIHILLRSIMFMLLFVPGSLLPTHSSSWAFISITPK